MSHYLSTINTAAADAINGASEVTPVGATVQYTMRLGHGRNGRTKFPAIVQCARPDGSLDLTVIIDAGDFSDEIMVYEAAPGREAHCWERIAAQPFESSGNSGQLDALRDEVADLRRIILGDYDAPNISLVDILADFEKRLSTQPKSATAPKKRGRPAKKK